MVKFYLDNMAILHPLTPRITPSYTHKMANVTWPQILWRHFTLCILQFVYLLTLSLSTSVQPFGVERFDSVDECEDRLTETVEPLVPVLHSQQHKFLTHKQATLFQK